MLSPASAAIDSISARSRAAVATTRMPARARPSVIARPRPRPAPVMVGTRPLSGVITPDRWVSDLPMSRFKTLDMMIVRVLRNSEARAGDLSIFGLVLDEPRGLIWPDPCQAPIGLSHRFSCSKV